MTADAIDARVTRMKPLTSTCSHGVNLARRCNVCAAAALVGPASKRFRIDRHDRAQSCGYVLAWQAVAWAADLESATSTARELARVGAHQVVDTWTGAVVSLVGAL